MYINRYLEYNEILKTLYAFNIMVKRNITGIEFMNNILLQGNNLKTRKRNMKQHNDINYVWI